MRCRLALSLYLKTTESIDGLRGQTNVSADRNGGIYNGTDGLFHLYTAFFGLFPTSTQRGLHWGTLGIMAFLAYPLGNWEKPFRGLKIALDLAIIGLFTAATAYLLLTWEANAFRIGAPPEEGLIARRLFPLQLIICASPDYLARHGAPDSLEALSAHRCSVFRHPETGRLLPWSVKVDGEAAVRDVAPALSTNDAELEVEAVMAGQLIGQLTGISAAAPIRSGRLVPLLTAHTADHHSVYLYYGSRTAQPARVRAFIDFCLERLVGNADYVLGDEELAAAEASGRRLCR